MTVAGTQKRRSLVTEFPFQPDDSFAAGAHVAVICPTITAVISATGTFERAGWTIRDSIRWETHTTTRFVVLARNELVLGAGGEPRIAETVIAAGAGVLHLSAGRVPGATPCSPHRWPPNLMLSHTPDCQETLSRFRDSLQAVAGCESGCPIRRFVTSGVDKKIAQLCPQFRTDTEALAWLHGLIEQPGDIAARISPTGAVSTA